MARRNPNASGMYFVHVAVSRSPSMTVKGNRGDGLISLKSILDDNGGDAGDVVPLFDMVGKFVCTELQVYMYVEKRKVQSTGNVAVLV